MKILTTRNDKGGVGKTTATGSIGAGLAKRGYKVLIIDADPQGNLTGWLAPKDAENTLKDVVEGETALESAIYEVSENLFILPTAENEALREIEFSTLLKNQRFFVKKNGFYGDLENFEFDYVLIDFAPTWSVLEIALGHLLDEVFIILEPEAFPVRGMRQQLAHVKQIEDIAEKEIRCDRIIISKINQSYNVHKDASESLAKNYQCLYVRQDSSIKKMHTEGKTPFDSEYLGTKSRADFDKIINEIEK